MTRLTSTLFILTFAVLTLASSPAFAQAKVLVLLTETTVADGEETDAFWWSNPSAVAWTATDEALRGAGGLEMVTPAAVERISRIYRRPRLSDTNAAALAELFGADVALVGTVRRQKLAIRPLGSSVYEIAVEARLVEPAAQGAVIRQSFSLTRLARGQAEEAMSAATGDASTTLAALASAALQRKVGPVGAVTPELTIALHGIPSLKHWAAIRTAMLERPDVDDVRVSWMAEGVVSVTLNPSTPDTTEAIRRIAQGLQNTAFETFGLSRIDGVAGTTALAVTARNAP